MTCFPGDDDEERRGTAFPMHQKSSAETGMRRPQVGHVQEPPGANEAASGLAGMYWRSVA